MEFALVDGESFSPSCSTLVMVRILILAEIWLC
jgi:hypothetical protein